MLQVRGRASRRYRTVLLNVLLILGLVLPAGLAASFGTTNQRSASAAASSLPASAVAALAGPRAKHKKHKERKQDRKQKDRKHDRQHKNRKHGGKRVRSGILPGADEPIGSDGELDATDHYIVRLKPDAGVASRATQAVARDIAGITPTFVYSHVFDGFAAVIPPDKLDAVRNDPRVDVVIPDSVVHAFAQTLPTGIRRVNADDNPTADIDGNDERVDVDVAVIDTAGKIAHEDLNTYAWANCTPSHTNGDDVGHGTHVSGTIGALDNDRGVVGVAPGARIWTLRSLIARNDGQGSGLTSWILCGLDIVTQYATDQGDGLGDIEVANLSLGGSGSDSNCATNPDDIYHQAYCQTVAAGVTVVVAAGNDDINASGVVPATYEEVITVSALADSNGASGGGGPGTIAGPDDSLAGFSNWGSDVDIAAPGVTILSTLPGGYGTSSGTSMAAPHVAGAAALYLATHANATPAQVKSALLAARENVALANDPDGINEGVLNVGTGFGATSADDAGSATAQHAKPKSKKHQKRR